MTHSVLAREGLEDAASESLHAALSRANTTLWLNITQLLAQDQQRWLQEFSSMLENRAQNRARYATWEPGQSRHADAMPAPDSWPAEVLSHTLRCVLGDVRGFTETAIGNHTAFACGLQEAVSEWQRDSARAFSRTASEAPLTQALRGIHP